MKKLALYLILAVVLVSCGSSDNGELIGVQNRPHHQEITPFGMVNVPAGSFEMGAGSENRMYDYTLEPVKVQVQAFWMDETEITNNEYRQFVYWVRDSIARRMLGTDGDNADAYLIEEDEYGEAIDPPLLNWATKIKWDGESEREVLNDLYLKVEDRFYGKKIIDVSKLNFEYSWIDYQAAAAKVKGNPSELEAAYHGSSYTGRPNGMRNRSTFIQREVINIYPDTLCWVHDYAYAYNEPMMKAYFSHVAYDHYPVVGITWKQAKAFSQWRTMRMNNALEGRGFSRVQDFRLPTEAEWEYAAKAGRSLSPLPWGGPYVNNGRGCFLANYKPNRGSYDEDGGINPVIVAHYAPNDFGLYDMSGNVSEWCEDAFNESSFNFTHDLNPVNIYRAKDDDAEVNKRKVIRGGSWKDQKFYIQTTARTYEYQDTAKCYIGFRNVMTYLGRNLGDNMKKASAVYGR